MKLKLNGYRSHGKLQINGVKKEFKKQIPDYFTIEIDLDKIKKRDKNEKK